MMTLRAEIEHLDFEMDVPCASRWCEGDPNPASHYVRGTEHAGHIADHEGRVMPECAHCRARYATRLRRCECGDDVLGSGLFEIVGSIR